MSHFWPYTIDIEGRFWNADGLQFDDPETLLFFLKQLEPMTNAPGFNDHGPFRAVCQGEECRFTAEDVPYVVIGLEMTPDQITLVFPGNYRETLDPDTLFVGSLNVLYCRVRGGKLTARFNRKTYMEIVRKIQFDPQTKSYYLPLAGKNHPIRGVQGEFDGHDPQPY